MALDQRRKTALLVTLIALAAVDAPRQAAAQPFGWLFGGEEPRDYRRAPRPRSRRTTPPRQYLLDDIPQPVPRPHFPGDPPAATPIEPGVPKPGTKQPEPAKTVAPEKLVKPEEPPEPDIAAPAKERPIQPQPDIAAPAEPKPLPGETAPAKSGAPLPPERPPQSELKPSLPVEAQPGPDRPAEMAKPKPPAEIKPPVEIKPPAETKPPEAAKPPQSTKPPQAAAPGTPANVPTPPQKPPELAKPGGVPGTVAPSGARLGEAPGQPDDDATCQDRLKARDVEIEPTDIGPQPDPRCTVVRAVHLKGLTLPGGAKVAFPEHPTIACTTADAFSLYVRDLLSPLAKGTFGTPVASVWTGPGLECRSRDHIFGAKLSAHGQGLAIDIAQLKLADGRMIDVGNAKDEIGQNFETAARNAACGYFHTVLGPGSDSYHRTHWHFDLEVRGSKGDSKFCK